MLLIKTVQKAKLDTFHIVIVQRDEMEIEIPFILNRFRIPNKYVDVLRTINPTEHEHYKNILM